MRTCGECGYWLPCADHKELGHCSAPVPEWAQDAVDELVSSNVRHREENAVICECYKPTPLEGKQ